MVAGETGKFQTGKGRRATQQWGDQGPEHQPWVPGSRWETQGVGGESGGWGSPGVLGWGPQIALEILNDQLLGLVSGDPGQYIRGAEMDPGTPWPI